MAFDAILAMLVMKAVSAVSLADGSRDSREHSKRAEMFRRWYRQRPAGAQSVDGSCSSLLPQRISGQVGDDHLLFAQAAAPHEPAGADWYARDRVTKLRRKIGCRRQPGCCPVPAGASTASSLLHQATEEV